MKLLLYRIKDFQKTNNTLKDKRDLGLKMLVITFITYIPL